MEKRTLRWLYQELPDLVGLGVVRVCRDGGFGLAHAPNIYPLGVSGKYPPGVSTSGQDRPEIKELRSALLGDTHSGAAMG